MISLVGFLRLDLSSDKRLKYLISCIKSFDYIKEKDIIVGLDIKDASNYQEIIDRINNQVKTQVNFHLINDNDYDYGIAYCKLLDKCKYDYILNLMEDHFSVCNEENYIQDLLKTMDIYGVSICKATFNKIENNSTGTIRPILSDDNYFIFDNDRNNHIEYQKYYGMRYYIGVNFITTKSFAYRFWNRKLGKRPHEYEMPHYIEEWRHNCIIPKKEILCSIDDEHGETNSHLLSRNNPKFIEIYDTII